MGWQRTVRDVVGLGTGVAGLVVPAAVKLPIALELGAAGVIGQRAFNVVPRHSAVLVHVVVSNSVGNPLVAQHGHEPVEQRRRVALFDCQANSPVVSSDLVYEVWFSGEATDAMNQSCRMVEG
jgi:hypothetical protein